ncbi:glycosyltransferase [Mucilaginibacter sp.]
MKKRILISAYAISPVKGSEYGAAWNTVVNLAKQHELWVLYGMSDDHMGDTQTLKSYIKANPLQSVNFIEVRPSKLANAINRLNKIGLGWFFYFAYYLWQKDALKKAEKLLENVHIDVVHQLGPIGFREPGFLGMLDKPLVWGPIGGMNIIKPVLLKGMPYLSQVKFGVKNTINKIQINFSSRIANAFQRADVLLAATNKTQHTIKEKFGKDSYLISEQGVIGKISYDEKKFERIYEQVELVWSGTHIDRKNLQLCLQALALVKQNNWVLHILGEGPLTSQLKKEAEKLNLKGLVIWHGHMSRNEAMHIMQLAHLHIITSISEDNPAVVFEAMSNGIPTLTLDHCGMGDVLCDKCAIKIPVSTNQLMAKEIACKLDLLISNPEFLANMAINTLSCAIAHGWDKRLKLLNTYYNEAIYSYNTRMLEKHKIHLYQC